LKVSLHHEQTPRINDEALGSLLASGDLFDYLPSDGELRAILWLGARWGTSCSDLLWECIVEDDDGLTYLKDVSVSGLKNAMEEDGTFGHLSCLDSSTELARILAQAYIVGY